MKSCSEIMENLSLYIDGELDIEARKELENHMANCEACKNELDELLKIIDICRNDQEELPSNFKAELHQKLVKASRETKNKSRLLLFRNNYFKIASSIAAVILLFFLIKNVFDIHLFSGLKAGDAVPQLSMADSISNREEAAVRSFSEEQDQNGANYDIDNKSAMENTQAAIGGFGSYPVKKDEDIEYSGSVTTDRASNENRESKYAMAASVAGESTFSSKNEIVITADDPDEKLSAVRTIAANNSGMEQTAIDISFNVALTGAVPKDARANETEKKVTTGNGTETAAPEDSLQLSFSIPNDRYESFMKDLTAELGKENIEPGLVVTEDVTARLQDMVKQSDALDIKIDELEKKNDEKDRNELEKLKEEKRVIQTSIDNMRLASDLTYVKIIVKKPSN